MQRVELKKTSNSPFVKGHKLGFQKGHSGYGLQVRRDKRLVSRALELELERTVKDKKGNVKKRLQRIADAIVTAAELGDVSAFNAIANRVEGMPTQIIEQNTNLNARVLAAQVTAKLSPAEAARMYQAALKVPDVDDDNGEWGSPPMKGWKMEHIPKRLDELGVDEVKRMRDAHELPNNWLPYIRAWLAEKEKKPDAPTS